jgi:hypothetical protein
MKDVACLRYASGSRQAGFDPGISEWGNPAGVIQSPVTESIGGEERTWGSETSQYPEEEKSKEIPPVAASERGRGQTDGLRSFGVVGLSYVIRD